VHFHESGTGYDIAPYTGFDFWWEKGEECESGSFGGTGLWVGPRGPIAESVGFGDLADAGTGLQDITALAVLIASEVWPANHFVGVCAEGGLSEKCRERW
jgi:hypothetical protein